jgi:ureidoacrylate peracid hydrolase
MVAREHWCSKRIRQYGPGFAAETARYRKLIVIGLIACTCVQATVRFAAELGYDVTMVKDATADLSDEKNARRSNVNILNYAAAIVTADEVCDGSCGSCVVHATA